MQWLPWDILEPTVTLYHVSWYSNNKSGCILFIKVIIIFPSTWQELERCVFLMLIWVNFRPLTTDHQDTPRDDNIAQWIRLQNSRFFEICLCYNLVMFGHITFTSWWGNQTQYFRFWQIRRCLSIYYLGFIVKKELKSII